MELFVCLFLLDMCCTFCTLILFLKPDQADLQKRQNQLKEQIKEAQELRANQETCRMRLLESIPPGLKLTESWSFCGFTKSSTPPLVADEESAKELATEDAATTPTKSNSSKPPPILLRDQISTHLAKTMQWLVTYHVSDAPVGNSVFSF